jgi:hypothetical protein
LSFRFLPEFFRTRILGRHGHNFSTIFARNARVTAELGRASMRHKGSKLARIAELSQVLTENAYRLELETSTADKWKRRIVRAIANKKAGKLRSSRYDAFIRRQKNRITREGAAALVRTTRLKRKRASETLNPIEERAVEILIGAKRKPKKNFVEIKAIGLVAAVRREWFSYREKRGRPKGARSQFKQTRVAVADVSLSIEEVILLVTRATKEITGNPPSSAVLVAAVRIEKPGTSKASVLRIATRIREKMRQI